MKWTIFQFARVVFLFAVTFFSTFLATSVRADIIFESGTLGPTGVTWNELENGTVPGTSVHGLFMPGVRFELSAPTHVTQIGGHFVSDFGGTFFGAIIVLENENDFPDSTNLSTPDLLGVATLAFPNPSAEVFGSLELRLDPGWYAMVFGSGLFGTSGSGGAVQNGTDIGNPSYIAFDPNVNWVNIDLFGTFFDNQRFVMRGQIVPEPSSMALVSFVMVALALRLTVPAR